MLIEIAGIPGSGKTTLFRHLSAELAQRGASFTDLNALAATRSGAGTGPRFVRRRPERDLLFRFTRFTARHPEFFALAERSFADATTRKFLFFLLAAHFQMARDFGEDGEMVFLDEGFLNHSVAMFPGPDRQKALTELLAVAPPIDVLIFLDTPAETAFKRVVERQGSGHDYHARSIQKFGDADAFATRRENFLAGVDLYRKNCGTTMTITPEQSAKDLAETLLSLQETA